jgi:hypothetical protein
MASQDGKTSIPFVAARARLTGIVIPRLVAKPTTWAVILVLGLAAGAGLYWFQPWRLFTSTTVADRLSSVPSAEAAPGSATSPTPVGSAARTKPLVVLEGSFVTHEHSTTGTARLVRNTDGSHQLELIGLDTSDGPDLRVWLTDQKVGDSARSWQVFDDGRHLELGRLKGNRGNQVYAVPGYADLQGLRSVSIWCKRFAVSFGAAALQ